MKALKSIALGASILFLGACSATIPTSAGTIAPNSGKKVSTTVSSMNFLGFNPMSLETSEGAIADLQAQCNGGEVTGVTSLASHQFLFVIVKESFSVSGYCK